MSTYNDEEKEKLSWRDIDKRKDESKHVSRERPYHKKSKLSRWALKQHLKEAEKLFMGKKGTEEYKRALNEIHKRHGTPKFNPVVKSFVKEYGLPDTWDTLFLLLDYKEPDIVTEVMSKLKGHYRERSLNEMQGFRAKLEIIAMTNKKEVLRTTAQKILEEL